MNKKFSAKLILLGEYTVLKGGSTLAIPLPQYYGEWSIDLNDEDGRHGLEKLYHWIEGDSFVAQGIKLERFKFDLERGLVLKSNIPLGYGLGSSGSVVAAVYDTYAIEPTKDLKELKTTLAWLEGAFHGQSSGTDPLVSYLGQPIIVRGKEVFIINTALDLSRFFLIDTSIKRNASPLIKWYNESLINIGEFRNTNDSLKNLNDLAIKACIKQNQVELTSLLRQISVVQHDHFRPMIPDSMSEIWNSDDYILKICGAGGGGMMLGYRLTEDPIERIGNYTTISLQNKV